MSIVRPRVSASSATSGVMRSRSWPRTTTRCCGATLVIACSEWDNMLRPAMVCSTFGVSDRIRLPGPAARTRTAVSPRNVINSPCALSHAKRAERRHAVKSVISPALDAKSGTLDCKKPERPKLRRQDSNLNYLNQNQRCCRLHHDGLFTHDELTGPRQQTLDGARARVAPSGSEEYSKNRNPANRYPE